MQAFKTFLILTALGLVLSSIPFGYFGMLCGALPVLVHSAITTYLIHGTKLFTTKPTTCCGGN